MVTALEPEVIVPVSVPPSVPLPDFNVNVTVPFVEALTGLPLASVKVTVTAKAVPAV